MRQEYFRMEEHKPGPGLVRNQNFAEVEDFKLKTKMCSKNE